MHGEPARLLPGQQKGFTKYDRSWGKTKEDFP
jgi:hypothetical protein